MSMGNYAEQKVHISLFRDGLEDEIRMMRLNLISIWQGVVQDPKSAIEQMTELVPPSSSQITQKAMIEMAQSRVDRNQGRVTNDSSYVYVDELLMLEDVLEEPTDRYHGASLLTLIE